MKVFRSYRMYLLFLVAVVAVGLAVSACNKGDGNDGVAGPSTFDVPATSSAPAPVPAPAPAAVGSGNLLVELLEQTFAEGRCTDLSQAPFNALSELMAKFKITNGLDSEAMRIPGHTHPAGNWPPPTAFAPRSVRLQSASK